MIQIYVAFVLTVFVYMFIIYLIQFTLDILLLSLVGYILSKIVSLRLKYKSVFNISAYAMTLSIILCMVYLVVNVFTGFEIKYFEIAYNAISYIYVLTALLIIKSDLIKQQMEVGKIVEEQKKVREENEQEKEDKKEDKKEKDKNKEEKQPKQDKPAKKKKENKEKPEDETPEGSEA